MISLILSLFPISHIPSSSPLHVLDYLILLDFIVLVMLGEEYKL
jgi:hypothetical protein